MKGDRKAKRSDLFLVRVWEDGSGGNGELRGKIQRTASGEAHYFRNLPELADLLYSMVSGLPTGASTQLPQPVASTDLKPENTPVGTTGEEQANPAIASSST